jgi:hypothetical protein
MFYCNVIVCHIVCDLKAQAQKLLNGSGIFWLNTASEQATKENNGRTAH